MAGIDLGNCWADGVWEEGVWASGVWADGEVPLPADNGPLPSPFDGGITLLGVDDNPELGIGGIINV